MTRRVHDEAGTSLVFVLVFMALCSVFSLAVLSITQGNFTVTSSVREVRSQNYTGDGAIELGVARVAADPLLASTPGACNFPLTGMNGQSASVTCTAVAPVGGPGSSRPRNALLALGSAAGQGVRVAGNSTLAVTGDVYSHSIVTLGQAQSRLDVTGQLLAEGAGDCADPRVTATVSKSCEAAGSPSGDDPAWPSAAGTTFVVPASVNPVPVCTNGASGLKLATFAPGKYTRTIAASLAAAGPSCTGGGGRTTLHFPPGLVYFENVAVDFASYDVVAGTAGGWLAAGQRPTGEAACSESSPGTQVLLGGSTTVGIANEISTLAFCAGLPNASGVSIALYGVRTNGNGLLAQSGAALSGVALDFNENKPRVYVHGSVYLPLADISIRMHNRSETVYDRGIVARSMLVDVSASSTQATSPISLPDCTAADPCLPTSRKVVFTAVVDGVDRVRSRVDFPVVGPPVVETWVVLR